MINVIECSDEKQVHMLHASLTVFEVNSAIQQ
jgi:hypothetical protein